MRNIMIAVMVLVICSFGTLSAQGFYIGAGIGNSFYGLTDVTEEVKNIDENATGYKFFGGFSTPTIFAVEGGYRNFGTIKVTELNIEIESQTTGWDVYGMAHFEVLMVLDLFAKAGVMFWKTENVILGESFGNSGAGFAWGLGAGVGLGPIGVRLEYENFNIEDPVAIQMLSLSATFGF
jgi:OOP family OmpA-OmpF porin